MWRGGRTDAAGERRGAMRGFTLIEVLVALAIFALASMMAYRGLDAVSETKATLDREIRFWRELGLIFDRMESDFLQIVPQAWSADGQTVMPPFRASRLGESGFVLELIRHDGNRPSLRTAYECRDGRLDLRVQPSAAGGTVAAQTLLLIGDVEQCEAAYLDAGNLWREAWPLAGNSAKPRAVRIRLGFRGDGLFERIYYLP